MNREKSTELKVGGTVILGVLLLVIGVMWGKDIQLASDYYQVDFIFRNSNGIKAGDPVTVNGVRKGNVADVGLRNNAVVVTAQISRSVVLRADVTASIVMQDLMGGIKLEISPGEAPGKFDPSQLAAPIPGEDAKGIGEMLAEFSSFKPKADSIMDMLLKSTSELAAILDKDQLQTPIHEGLASLNRIAAQTEKLLQAVEKDTENAVRDAAQAARAMKFFMDENQQTIASTIVVVGAASKKLDSLTVSLGEIVDQIHSRRGTVGKLIYEDDLYVSLQKTAMQADSLTKELRMNLGKYLHGVDIKLLNLIDVR